MIQLIMTHIQPIQHTDIDSPYIKNKCKTKTESKNIFPTHDNDPVEPLRLAQAMEARVAHSYYRQLIAALLACAAAKDEARAPGGDGVLHLDVKVCV
jgi:hypothetical protein